MSHGSLNEEPVSDRTLEFRNQLYAIFHASEKLETRHAPQVAAKLAAAYLSNIPEQGFALELRQIQSSVEDGVGAIYDQLAQSTGIQLDRNEYIRQRMQAFNEALIFSLSRLSQTKKQTSPTFATALPPMPGPQ